MPIIFEAYADSEHSPLKFFLNSMGNTAENSFDWPEHHINTVVAPRLLRMCGRGNDLFIKQAIPAAFAQKLPDSNSIQTPERFLPSL